MDSALSTCHNPRMTWPMYWRAKGCTLAVVIGVWAGVFYAAEAWQLQDAVTYRDASQCAIVGLIMGAAVAVGALLGIAVAVELWYFLLARIRELVKACKGD